MDSFLVSAIGNAIYTLFRSKERALLGDFAMPERTVGMHRNSPPFFISAQFSASARRNAAARRSSGASAQRVAAISAPALYSSRARIVRNGDFTASAPFIRIAPFGRRQGKSADVASIACLHDPNIRSTKRDGTTDLRKKVGSNLCATKSRTDFTHRKP